MKKPPLRSSRIAREDAWRVEVRQAAPVDRTVHAHQRDRVQVADDAVGLDRLVGHFLTGLSNFRRYRRKKPPFCPSLSHWGSLLLRFHSLDGRQGFDVCRDGDPILGRELRSTANHLGHGRCLSFRPSKPALRPAPRESSNQSGSCIHAGRGLLGPGSREPG